ncbi:hypothetical protein COCC4DRAFT_129228 [Bipolaris maydis ATCC 48331]|uniref:Uncharacterized protein n=2 Tax=Cochliobolus heterostrophus TaxID=5016 RepID=M2UCU1_COCH5|nr:uncharacterized protein COCC4DRAFT_129228 [Bipolaris maydis ATCC 48331]EMD91521.1 hypothetical protein COCHEDRAFT_1102193 [Bipolaris maydis C5]ENI08721.1 hypothetical protein COCC4DRAFT_129228 [Bipolaris maydis ATCC 48331]
MQAGVSDARTTHPGRRWARFLSPFYQNRTGMDGPGRLTKNGCWDLRGCCNSEFCCRVSHLPASRQWPCRFRRLGPRMFFISRMRGAPSQAWLDVTFAQPRADANTAPDFYWR